MVGRASFVVLAICCFASAAAAQPAITLPVQPTDPLAWPEVTQTARPWTRWWWLGSAVDEANITRLLETYKAAGIGGVEITSIYGVKGTEDRVRPYLSDSWKAAVAHTLREARRLGMGVDLPTGSGWRTGGPSVTEEDGNRQVVLRSEAAPTGGNYEREFRTPRPQAVVAYGRDKQVIELTDKITADGKLNWQVPSGNWTVYTLSQEWSRDTVKRPAPGGEGRNINPYSRRSLDHFLDYFGDKLGDLPAQGIRSQFHDSFEYEGNWCDEFLAEFEKRRGYRLQEHLPALAANMGGGGARGRRGGRGADAQSVNTTNDAPAAPSEDEVARVKHDYRETLSDLVLDNLIIPWRDWSHAHGMLARNQSHGSPANWLDLYGAVDIPETESFGRLNGGDGHPLVFKFASSAAHVMGRPCGGGAGGVLTAA